MRFLVDECLHESLVGVAHGAGFEATHVNHLGLRGNPDWALAERIIAEWRPRLDLLRQPMT
jgi:predicted nuclease of predicted toxin-antitoxin system